MRAVRLEMDLLKQRYGEKALAPTKVADKHGLLPKDGPWVECFPGLSPFRQFPLDVNHSELKGMCSRYLDLLLEQILNVQGQTAFRQALTVFANPPGWQAFQNPLTHRKSYGFTELGRLVVISPFLLDISVTSSGVRPSAQSVLLGMSTRVDMLPCADGTSHKALQNLICVYANMAQHVATCLKSSFSIEELQELNRSSIGVRDSFQRMTPCYNRLDKDRGINTKEAEALCKLPNVHIGLHLAEVATRYGNLTNVCTTMGEEKHKETKRNVSFTSPGQDPIKQLMQKIQVQRGLSNAEQAPLEDQSYMANFVRELRTSHPILSAHSVPSARMKLFSNPTLFPRSDTIDVNSSHVTGRNWWPPKRVRLHGFECDVKGSQELRQKLIKFYHGVGIVVGDLGSCGLHYCGAMSFVKGEKRRQIKVGNTFWHPTDLKLVFVVALCEHELGARSTSMLHYIHYEKVGRSELLGLDIYRLPDVHRVSELPWKALGYLSGTTAAHLVPIPPKSDTVLRSAREFYHNQWWVPFH